MFDFFSYFIYAFLEFDIEDFKDLKAHSGKVIFFEHVRKLKEEKELD